MFMETSAMSGNNVEEAFHKCAKSILAKIESGLYEFSCHGLNLAIVYIYRVFFIGSSLSRKSYLLKPQVRTVFYLVNNFFI